MADIKVRFFIEKRDGQGRVRYYWQPSTELRRKGFTSRRLADSRDEAVAEAQRYNDQVDHWRGYERAAVPPALAKPTHTPRRGAGTIEGVYIIGPIGGPYKIGRSNNPTRRLAALQTSNAKPLHVLFYVACVQKPAALVETLAHRRLARCRQPGEWFDVPLTDAILAIMRTVTITEPGSQLPHA